MAIEFSTTALISSCNKLGQVCIADSIFWGVVLILALGVIKAIAGALHKEEPKPSWKLGDTKEAPEGFKWVLVRESELDKRK